MITPVLSAVADAGGSVSFATWQSVIVMVTTAFAAVIAHYGLAVFNDGARPFMLDFIRGNTSRMATATIVFGLSAGFIFGLGAPMALSTGVLNPWLIFLPAEILGLLAPWRWLAGAAGLAWGAVCAYGLSAVNSAAQQLPVDFITALQQIGTPILWLFAMFPVIAVARQFGRTRGLITFGAEAAVIVASTVLFPSMFAGSLAMAIGVILLLVFALTKDRSDKRVEVAALAGMDEATRAEVAAAKASSEEAVNQLFGPNAERLRKNVPWLAILGGLVAALSATHIFAGGEATSFLIADGNIVEAAQVDFYRAFGFIPLIATTALASGAYALAGFTFVYPAGYLLGHVIDNPAVALAVAFVVGALIFWAEVIALSALGKWLQRWPSVRDSADHIRNAIHESLQVAILVGSLMAALAMGGGLGIFIVGGLYLLNDAIGRPVVRMAAGPAAVIVGGIVLNLLYLVGLFTPVAG
ncbi:YhfT family protein [Georgenia sp. MJ206]|uniref:YhfT family protein n=1 Tax=Georgenia wangjunii TaxID=3117730 RepID=UPI002F2600A7